MTPLPRAPLARSLPWILLLLGFATTLHAAPGFDPVAETEKLINTLPAEARAKSDAYFEGGYIIQVWNLAFSLFIAWVLLKFGVTVRLRDIAERFSRPATCRVCFPL
ncbi:MAG: hypothetical protein EXS42_05355 [Lacunisphaera sp.]|nr:hypothetical protein [Lacunisphaera sp.]